MRSNNMVLVAVALGLSMATGNAAPVGGAGGVQDAAPAIRLVQGNEYGGYTYGWGFGYGYNYIPACPYNYHYACWSDPYGYRHCGCLPNRGW